MLKKLKKILNSILKQKNILPILAGIVLICCIGISITEVCVCSTILASPVTITSLIFIEDSLNSILWVIFLLMKNFDFQSHN